MVTHDVDEALFLSDRIAHDDQRPGGQAGRHPRASHSRGRATRAAVLEHPEYYELREKLIGFLEEHAVSKAA